MTRPVVLACTHVTKSFVEGAAPVEVLKGVNFQVNEGERLAIVGNSGSGKTTLLNMLGGLDLPTSGQVVLKGYNLNELSGNKRGALRNRYIGFIYQFHHLLPEFTALENVAMPLLIGGSSIKIANEKAALLLDDVGLAHRRKHKPSQLSGGERQRVAVARALVTSPACVLADEPTGNLDSHMGNEIMEIIESLHKDHNTTVVMVTHDEAMAKRTERIIRVFDGQLVH